MLLPPGVRRNTMGFMLALMPQRSQGSATPVSRVRSVRAWGSSTGPTARALGGGGRASPGGVPSAVVRGAWGQAPPLPRLPALWAGCRGSLATGCGCWGCGRGDPSPTPQRALLRSVGAE